MEYYTFVLPGKCFANELKPDYSRMSSMVEDGYELVRPGNDKNFKMENIDSHTLKKLLPGQEEKANEGEKLEDFKLGAHHSGMMMEWRVKVFTTVTKSVEVTLKPQAIVNGSPMDIAIGDHHCGEADNDIPVTKLVMEVVAKSRLVVV